MITFFDDYLTGTISDYIDEAYDSTEQRNRTLRIPYEYVHYSYNIEDLFDEVYKRTSMIGRHRFNKEKTDTELDHFALTEDERETFDQLCETAAHDVFEKIIGFTRSDVRSFFYDEGADNTVEVTENSKAVTNITTTVTQATKTATATLSFTVANHITSNEKILFTIPYTYQVNDFMGRVVTREGEVQKTYVYKSGDESLTSFSITNIDLPITLDDSPSVISGVDPESLVASSVVIGDVTYRFQAITPTEIPYGSYVEYTKSSETKLYIALQDTDTNADITDTTIFAPLSVDFRHTVHYIVLKPKYIRENSLYQSEHYLKEAIVCNIISNWFFVVNTAEYENFEAMYQKRLADVKACLCTVGTMQVTSHPF